MKCFTLEYLMHFSTVKSHLEAFTLCTLNCFDSFYRHSHTDGYIRGNLVPCSRTPWRADWRSCQPSHRWKLIYTEHKINRTVWKGWYCCIMNFTPTFPSACIYLRHSNVLLCIWQPCNCLLWTVTGVTKMIVVLLCDTFYFLFRHVTTAFNITTMTFVQTIKERKKIQSKIY